MKLKAKDKNLIKAYVKWCLASGLEYPSEYEVSKIIMNLNADHRYLVEDYIESLKEKVC